MSNPSLVIVLAEDEHHSMLVFRYLKKCGLTGHAIRIQRSPSGQGSAENWVLKRFAEETNEYRVRQARAQTVLVVIIDADIYTVQHRFNQLDQALRTSKYPVVDQGEQIARLVPKRNVETWILCLNQRVVDEETNYKTTGNDWNQLIRTASETLRQWTRSTAQPPDHCLDSLRTGVRELKRLRL